MAKVIVKIAFKDKFNTALLYKVGQEVEFSDPERVKDLTSRGLVEVVGNAEPVEVTETETADMEEASKPKSKPKRPPKAKTE